MSLAQIQKEDRRYQILYLLSKEPDYAMNDILMHKALKMIGHGVDPDLLKSDLHWLEMQGLIKNESVGSFTVSKINRRGVSVAEGDAFIPGISRSTPEE